MQFNDEQESNPLHDALGDLFAGKKINPKTGKVEKEKLEKKASVTVEGMLAQINARLDEVVQHAKGNGVEAVQIVVTNSGATLTNSTGSITITPADLNHLHNLHLTMQKASALAVIEGIMEMLDGGDDE